MTKIHASIDSTRHDFLQSSLALFFKEIDHVCEHNGVKNFQTWFTERTYMSLYLAAQIRNDSAGEVSTIQEYSVKDTETNSNGRCDALLAVNKTLYILESKSQNTREKIKDIHWNIDAWTEYDNKVFEQLKWYVAADELYYLGENRYEEVFLQTIVFKIIYNDKDKHLEAADKFMNTTGNMLGGRGWYYGCYYPKALQDGEFAEIGIEVYGSIFKTL